MTDILERNLVSRKFVHGELRREVVGPDPRGVCTDMLPVEMSAEEFRGRYVVLRQGNGEEVLRNSPSRRYGAGVLFQRELGTVATAADDGSLAVEEAAGMLNISQDPGDDDRPPASLQPAQQRMRKLQADADAKAFDVDIDDAGLALANGFRPCSLGVSFVVDLDAFREGDGIRIKVGNRWRIARDGWDETACGWYREHRLKVSDNGGAHDRSWWLRTALLDGNGQCPELPTVTAQQLRDQSRGEMDVPTGEFPGRLAIRWLSRRWPGGQERLRLVTVTLLNSAAGTDSVGADRGSLFQAGLVVSAANGAIRDYPRELIQTEDRLDPLDDELVNRVTYSKRTVRAVGHGCGADWGTGPDGRFSLWTDVMPAWEMSPMAFDVKDGNGQPLQLPMRAFATLLDDCRLDAKAMGLLRTLVGAYEAWINALQPEAFPDELRKTADGLVQRCRDALERMREGIGLLEENPDVARAFALANRAMLMAQHQRPGLRSVTFERDQPMWSPPHRPLDLHADEVLAKEDAVERPAGHWRPFQLGFLLMSLQGMVDPDSDDREAVDLIWFPTGGGKTEAYLGFTAFTVFHGLLSGAIEKDDVRKRSVTVLMRYTLRLLTSQQFERAVRLFCAMELIRTEDQGRLGMLPLRVGLWVGSASTPNRVGQDSERDTAAHALKELAKHQTAENPFVLLQCPWCGAPFGRVRSGTVHGYEITGNGAVATFRFKCKDSVCAFGPGKPLSLPAQVVDDCLYRDPPTLLIGTVDKFAMLAWRPEARRFFGIGRDGRRVAAAPSLIIQDEMHLITGPLGTMVGLYETVVEALCLHDDGLIPKVIASTATAARAGDQVKGLFARESLSVFPPPGLDASDSFFAREDHASPGRLYVGVLAPGHGSMQTTQRHVYAALLQAAADVAAQASARGDDPADAADPWWTLLAYYNSLRELGGALTLFGADIREQLGVLEKRRGLDPRLARRVYADGRVMELTGRLQSDAIPEALRALERGVRVFKPKDAQFSVGAEYGPMDACLASNIIEVGVDVPRLSLMAIVGQPKTTSAYIQASSRVGRREDRPGLVVMMYSATKPRDRSHYERFRAYHQAIYACVEPTSVTPFSLPVVDRALHAAIVALVRQTSMQDLNAREVLAAANRERECLEEVFDKRTKAIARNDERDNVMQQLYQRLREWQAYNPEHFGSPWQPRPDNPALMYPAGSDKPREWGRLGWATPTSLRSVDAVCEARVTDYYAGLAAIPDNNHQQVD